MLNINSPDKDIETGQQVPAAMNGGLLHQNGASVSTSMTSKEENNSNLAWLKRPCLIVAIGIKWLPVAFITSIIGWSYYAFVVVVCLYTIDNLAQKIILLMFYHMILILFVWSYFKTIFAPKCDAPSTWKLSQAMVERLNTAASESEWKSLLELFVVEMNLSVLQRSVQGAIRYCDKCEAVKPDRSHHCSVCGACVLKMDHHCPWVNNCVAFNNYKFFMLFLGYALVYCLFLAFSVLQFFIQFWTNDLDRLGRPELGSGKFHILFLFFVSVMFCISVSSLFWYHVYLVLHNRSTLEQFRAPYYANGPDENGWSLGKRNNFQEVFGDRVLFWFLPLQTSVGDGLTFPTRITASGMDNITNYQSISRNSRDPMTSGSGPAAAATASPAANAVRGVRNNDIKYIDELASDAHFRNNGISKHINTQVVMGNDERIQVRVSNLPKSDLMELQ